MPTQAGLDLVPPRVPQTAQVPVHALAQTVRQAGGVPGAGLRVVERCEEGLSQPLRVCRGGVQLARREGGLQRGVGLGTSICIENN